MLHTEHRVTALKLLVYRRPQNTKLQYSSTIYPSWLAESY